MPIAARLRGGFTLPMEPDRIAAEAMSRLAQGLPALPMLLAARERHPAHAGLALAVADALHHERRLTEAVEAYAEAQRLNPTSADAWYGAGCANLSLKAAGAAASCLARAAALAPYSGRAQYNLGKALFELGEAEAAVAAFLNAERLEPELTEMARASIAAVIPGCSAADHAAVLQHRRRWADGLPIEAAAPSLKPVRRAPGRRLRIGYLSAFFGDANWMKPVFALINRHDRARFDVVMLSDGAPPSADSGYVDHAADVVAEVRGVPNHTVAGIVRELDIDVLVDLNGYSHQQRLGLLALRPALHVVAWFNMFATSGVTAVDWLVGDDAVIRPDEERFYTERIYRIPGSYLAFEVRYPVPDVAPPPCTARSGLVFGCLGSQYKLTDQVLAAWARILQQAPAVRLFLKNGGLSDASVQQHLLGRLQRHGIEPGRVTMQGRSPHFAFLDAYREVDIALDTFPYNGGTTTTEALWQGVPVLTFDGDRWASRTSTSLLRAAGLSEWVMADADAYVARAVALANDPATPSMLAALRAGMRDRLLRSPACDADGLCRAMEAFYRRLCEGR
ncbi:MAG: hypothetical protein U1E70_22005 [Acetobacteraceae bacterium]